jgi:hypothetical protein
MPAVAAQAFTTCQITFSVMPSPHTEPFRLTHRKTLPSVMGAAATQLSIAALTPSTTRLPTGLRRIPVLAQWQRLGQRDGRQAS